MQKMRFVLIILIIASFVSCKSNKDPGIPENAINPDAMKNPATASGGSDKSKVPVFQFEKETHDFGRIVQGEVVQYAFKFTNTGTGDLVIRSANGSCGCTVPEWPREPIPPGGSGTINITFNSEGRNGMQHKKVTIISNTIPNTKELNITGEVANADGSVTPNNEGH